MTNSLTLLVGKCRVLVVALTTILFSGCIIDGDFIEDEFYDDFYYADLVVDWQVRDMSESNYCAVLGIDHWILAITGPESRRVYRDCAFDVWSSELDLVSLYEGYYRIRLEGRDSLGRPVSELRADVDLDSWLTSTTYITLDL